MTAQVVGLAHKLSPPCANGINEAWMQAQLRSGSSGSSGEGLQALCHGLVLPKVRLTRARRRSHVQPSQALRDSDCGLARDCGGGLKCSNRLQEVRYMPKSRKPSWQVQLLCGFAQRGEVCGFAQRGEVCGFAQRGEVCGFAQRGEVTAMMRQDAV